MLLLFVEIGEIKKEIKRHGNLIFCTKRTVSHFVVFLGMHLKVFASVFLI